MPLSIAEGSSSASAREFAHFLGYAFRSTKEVITCLELCQRIYPGLPRAAVESLIDEGEQIARMTHALVSRLKS